MVGRVHYYELIKIDPYSSFLLLNGVFFIVINIILILEWNTRYPALGLLFSPPVACQNSFSSSDFQTDIQEI